MISIPTIVVSTQLLTPGNSKQHANIIASTRSQNIPKVIHYNIFQYDTPHHNSVKKGNFVAVYKPINFLQD